MLYVASNSIAFVSYVVSELSCIRDQIELSSTFVNDYNSEHERQFCQEFAPQLHACNPSYIIMQNKKYCKNYCPCINLQFTFFVTPFFRGWVVVFLYCYILLCDIRIGSRAWASLSFAPLGKV